MIRSVRDKRIPFLRAGRSAKGFPADLITRAQRKLAQIDAATTIADLRVPPSNNLESLKGDRQGQYSIRIRINDQFRICFVWWDGDAHNVEIIDYH